jgi:signal transduction histidine kinase
MILTPIDLTGDEMSSVVLASVMRRGSGASFETKVIGICLTATLGALVLVFSCLLWEDWEGDRVDLAADQIRLGQFAGSKVAGGTQPGATDLREARAVLESSDNVVAAVWFPLAGGRVPLATQSGKWMALQPGGGWRPSSKYGVEGLVTRVPHIADGRRAGELVLLSQASDLDAMLVRNALFAVLLSAFATAMSGLVARSLARRSLRPLCDLERGMDVLRRSHDFKGRVAEGSNDEFGRLTGNFNALLSDLQAYDERQTQSMQALAAARDTAEEANVLKSQFLANMSHEIRTPLNGVIGMAQVIASGPLEPAQRERLEVIETSGAALLSILNDILDLSKIEAGRLDLEKAPFDIAEVAESAAAIFEPVAGAKGLSFVLDLSDDAKGLWRGDAVRVRQLVSNLVSNAVKFTAKGEVRVRIGATPAVAGPALTIRVSDTGIGIAPDVLPKIFDKFVQADAATTRRFGGTGLGLTICRHIAGLMGGAIEVRSRVGRGSVFEVRLPLVKLGGVPRRDPLAALAEPRAAIDLGALKVLAADDNATNRLVIKAVLGALGVEPRIVDDGRQAVEAWKAGDFDLVLMDIQMPVLDGVQATREIRRLEAECGRPRTQIVAVTANAMKHQVDEYLAAGLDGHLSKPIIVSSLSGVLNEAALRLVVEADQAA